MYPPDIYRGHPANIFHPGKRIPVDAPSAQCYALLVINREESHMTEFGRQCCNNALAYIAQGHLENARFALRTALQHTNNARAKSKLMLALRELKRAIG
jgi:hypothetical protein